MSAARSARTKPAAKPTTLDVVCFGEALWDLFERPGSRDGAGEPIAREFRRELGGAPANVATGLARLGVAAAVAGGIGLDTFGDALEKHLRDDHVATRFLIRLPNRTGITFVARDALGEPKFLPYRQETADVAVRAEHVTSDMGRARWVLVGTSTMMTPSLAAATDRFLTVAEGAKAHVVVDLNVREHLWASKAQMRDAVAQLVRRASIVKGSFADLVAITGRRDILWLADHAPRAAWIVTQGPKGASALGDHGFVARPGRKAKCVDATGAGDAFIAGVLAVLLEAGATPGSPAWKDERVWSAALDAGHAMGAKAVSRVGAVTGLEDLGEVSALVKSVKRLPARPVPPEPRERRGARVGAKRRAR
ncbi:MAG TPA: carbohydrate kinase [Polyangiaceae bacterium]|jgi:fructokinase